MNKGKILFFEKINKIYNFLTEQTKKKQGQITNIRNEEEGITAVPWTLKQ